MKNVSAGDLLGLVTCYKSRTLFLLLLETVEDDEDEISRMSVMMRG